MRLGDWETMRSRDCCVHPAENDGRTFDAQHDEQPWRMRISRSYYQPKRERTAAVPGRRSVVRITRVACPKSWSANHASASGRGPLAGAPTTRLPVSLSDRLPVSLSGRLSGIRVNLCPSVVKLPSPIFNLHQLPHESVDRLRPQPEVDDTPLMASRVTSLGTLPNRQPGITHGLVGFPFPIFNF
jgi:hypothetical protein